MTTKPRREAVLSVRLEEAHYAALYRIARIHGQTISQYVRTLLDATVKDGVYTNVPLRKPKAYTEVISCPQK